MTSPLPEKKKPGPAKGSKKTHNGKGSAYEWRVARSLSKWLTNGEDDTQLVRSNMSGGNLRLRAPNAGRPEFQVGDISPNGPQGEWFRQRFGLECKNYGLDPDWWHCITYENWVVEGWWKKISAECFPFNLQPLLVMLRDSRPEVVMLDSTLCRKLHVPWISFPRMGTGVITMKEFQSHAPLAWVQAAEEMKQKMVMK